MESTCGSSSEQVRASEQPCDGGAHTRPAHPLDEAEIHLHDAVHVLQQVVRLVLCQASGGSAASHARHPPNEGGQRRTAKRWALPGEMAQPRAVVLFTSEAGTNGSCDAEVPCWRLLGRQLLGWSSDIRRSQGRGGLSPFSETDPLLTDSAVAGCREVGLGVGLFRHDQQPLRLVALELHAVAQEGTHLLLRDPDDRLGRRAAKAARPRTAGDPQHRPSTLACPIHPEGVSALPEVVGVFASCIVVGRSCDVPLADETRMGDGAPQETNKNVTKLAHFEKSMPTNSTETPFFGVAPDPNRRQPCKGSELC